MNHTRLCWVAAIATLMLAGCSSSDGGNGGGNGGGGATGGGNGGGSAGGGTGGGTAGGSGGGTGGGTAGGSGGGTGGGTAGGSGGGSGSGGGTGGGTAGPVLPKPTHGSSIAITTDDLVIAAVNADDDTMSIINATNDTKTNSVSFVGGNQMPVSVAIHPDNLTAYVVLRKAQKLVKITNLTGATPTVGASVSVGSEPTNVALSPSGKYAVVTNFGDDSISIVNTAAMTAQTVVVGQHPRAVAITNNLSGVDDNETAYVTLFYGAPVSEGTDNGRVGKVIPVPLGTKAPGAAIDLNPIVDTGFGVLQADAGSSANPVGCAPNQLYNIVINGTKAYIVHVCAAPRGPVSPTANLFAGLSVINLAATPPVEDVSTSGSVALSKLISTQDVAGTASLLGVPVDIDFKKGAVDVAYVLSQAGDVVQRVQYGAAASPPILLGIVGAFQQIDTRAATGFKVGTGIITGYTVQRAWTNNWLDKSVSTITLSNQAVSTVIVSQAKPTGQALVELRGKAFYFTSTGRWALRGVSSCGSCHPDGLSDNITWIFGAGPRQTIAMDGTYAKAAPFDQRALNWTAIFDEVHDFEGNVRGTSGGKGALTTGTPPTDVRILVDSAFNPDGGAAPLQEVGRQDFLSGSAKEVTNFMAAVKDWNDLDAFVKKIPSNKPPSSIASNAAGIAAGRLIFSDINQGNCATCHAGPKWTVSTVSFTPSLLKNGTVAVDAGQLLGVVGPNGLRTQTLDGGALDFTAAGTVNKDTFKVRVETAVTIEDGGTGNVGPERITCVLRNVGTFNVATERKADGTMGQGANGINPPSLLGLATSAPYLHNGSAANIQAVLSGTHMTTGNTNFTPTQADKNNLEIFLLSIDQSTAPLATPTASANKTFDICGGY